MTPALPVSPLARPLAVALYYACHAAAAALLSLPATALVAGTGIGGFEGGDRLLFEPGGAILAEVARVLSPEAETHVTSSLGAATLLGVLLLAPHAALLVTLSRKEREPPKTVWGLAFERLPTLLSLSGAAALAQVVLLSGTFILAAEFRASLGSWTTRSADVAYLFAIAVGLFVVLAVGIARDLGRAAAVRGALGAKAALEAGLKALARAPGRALYRWALPAAAGVALVAVGAGLTSVLDVSRPGEWRVALVALVHQIIALALCFCRAFWLSASLGLATTNER
jgi:hypothetical protein